MVIEYIFQLMNNFSDEELKDLNEWSKSPIFILRKKVIATNTAIENSLPGTDGQILHLFDTILENIKNPSNIILSNFSDYLYETVYKFRTKDEKNNFNKRLGELKNNYIEKFIGLQEIIDNTATLRWKIAHLRYLSKNNLNDQYLTLKNKIEVKLNFKYNTALDSELLFQHTRTQAGYYSSRDIALSNVYLTASGDPLQAFYFQNILTLNSELLNRFLLFNKIPELLDFPNINESALENNIFLKLQYKVHSILHKIYEICTNSSSEKIEVQELKEIFDTLSSIQPKELSSSIDLATICFCLINICRFQINNGEAHFIELLFQVTDFINEHNLHTQNNNINIHMFKLLVELAVDFEQIERAELYYDKYLKNGTIELPKKEADVIVFVAKLSFNQKVILYLEALILFYKKDFQASLQKVKFIKYTKNERFDIDLDKLLLKLYTELNNIDERSLKLVSAKKKVSNINEDMSFNKKGKMLNFISILKSTQLNIFDKNKNKKLLEKKYAENILSIHDKKWLNEKYT